MFAIAVKLAVRVTELHIVEDTVTVIVEVPFGPPNTIATDPVVLGEVYVTVGVATIEVFDDVAVTVIVPPPGDVIPVRLIVVFG